MRLVKLALIIPFAASLCACSSVGPIDVEDTLYNHVVAMDRDGTPLDITRGNARMPNGKFKKQHLASIKEALEEHRRKYGKECSEKNCGYKAKQEIMIYVHGARTFSDVSLAEVRQKHYGFRATNKPWYPIFFNWKGAFLDTYGDQLLRVRQGRYSPVSATLSSPLFFAYDLLGMVPRFPIFLFNQLNHIKRAELPQLSSFESEARRRHLQEIIRARHGGKASCKGPDCKSFKITKQETHDQKMSIKTVAAFPRDAVRFVPQAAVGPLLESVGSEMWKNYRLRTNAAIWRMSDFTRVRSDAEVGELTGTLAMLMQALDEYQHEVNASMKDGKDEENGKDEFRLKISLFGHSTGTLILSNLIRAFPNLDYERIVFLGAAATVKDFVGVIVPYLEKHQTAKFYNASLDGYAEARRSFGLILPYGSVLEWLDNSIAEPASYLDLVIGKWDNTMLAMHLVPCDVRDRVVLKQMPYDDHGYPQNHGDIADFHAKFDPFSPDSWEEAAVPEGKQPQQCGG